MCMEFAASFKIDYSRLGIPKDSSMYSIPGIRFSCSLMGCHALCEVVQSVEMNISGHGTADNHLSMVL